MFLGIACLSKARVADQLLEPEAVKLAGRSLEIRIYGNLSCNLRIAEIEAELSDPLVEGEVPP